MQGDACAVCAEPVVAFTTDKLWLQVLADTPAVPHKKRRRTDAPKKPPEGSVAMQAAAQLSVVMLGLAELQAVYQQQPPQPSQPQPQQSPATSTAAAAAQRFVRSSKKKHTAFMYELTKSMVLHLCSRRGELASLLVQKCVALGSSKVLLHHLRFVFATSCVELACPLPFSEVCALFWSFGKETRYKGPSVWWEQGCAWLRKQPQASLPTVPDCYYQRYMESLLVAYHSTTASTSPTTVSSTTLRPVAATAAAAAAAYFASLQHTAPLSCRELSLTVFEQVVVAYVVLAWSLHNPGAVAAAAAAAASTTAVAQDTHPLADLVNSQFQSVPALWALCDKRFTRKNTTTTTTATVQK
jgi:hypothetical protein